MQNPQPIILLLLLCLPSMAAAGLGEAVEKVREGVDHYKRGDYKTAGKAFAQADAALPDNPQIIFDKACALAAAGDADKAVGLYQQAALSPNRDLSARCYFNLGCLAAAKARKLFGEHPEQATVEVRTEGVDLLRQAVGRYRDCLKTEPDHVDARHNLEIIRLWIKHMQAVWQERDREKKRKETGLLDFLLMIEGRQRELRATGKALAIAADSPQRRQAFAATESAQRQLQEEIEPLKEKIKAEFKPPQQAPGTASPGAMPPAAMQPARPSPEKTQAMELLSRLADEAGDAMVSAADLLGEEPKKGPGLICAKHPSGRSGKLNLVPFSAQAAQSQAKAVEKLDQIYMAVAPFPHLVQRSVRTEQGLVDQSIAVVEKPDESAERDRSGEPDFAEMAWNQRFVAGWSQIMVPKAKQGLKNLDAKLNAMAAAPPAAQTPQSGSPQPATDPEARKKQLEGLRGLRKSMEKAVELAPKVHELTTQAVTDLKQERPADALPKQEEALKLLKEIAEPLPKKNQQQDQKKDQKKNQQKDQKKDQKKDKKDQNKQDKQKKDQQKQNQQKKQPKPRDLSKKQAEAVLRKARQRQREHEDMKKRLQRLLYQPGKVEKDW